MTNNEYIENVLKTKSSDYNAIIDRLSYIDIDLFHAVMGLSTEAGEALDMFKKHIYYGKEFDEINLIEEIGDAMWYLAIACNALDITFEQVMEKNIEKLKARYGDKFSEEKANNRNLNIEREVLEK